jgi:2-polyprenyl-3-methyl-5-hydroxy-6-metoxy-1,4-benzoquinol methylase
MRNYSELKQKLIPEKYWNHLKGDVLDIGCNECIIPEKLKINKKNYLGIDIDADALKVAKNKGFRVKKVDINNQNLPLNPNSIDSFLCLDVLEHLQDPLEAIKKIKKVLKSDALGIISLPNDLNLVNLIKVLLLGRPLLIREKMWDPHSHLHFPPISESKKLISKNFSILSIEYIPNSFTVPFLPGKIKKILANISPRFFARNVVFLIKNTK